MLSYRWPANRPPQSMRLAAQFGSRFPLRNCLALLLMTLPTVAGCGSKHTDRVPVFPVSGQVLWNGQPLPNAFVVLHPQGQRDPRAVSARGQTDQQGNFRVTTYEAGDGAPVGNYVVTVAYHQLTAAGGGYEPGPNVLPPKYAGPETTDLTVHVAEGPNQLPPLTLHR